MEFDRQNHIQEQFNHYNRCLSASRCHSARRNGKQNKYIFFNIYFKNLIFII